MQVISISVIFIKISSVSQIEDKGVSARGKIIREEKGIGMRPLILFHFQCENFG